MLWGRAVHAMQQLRGSDGSYRDVFVRTELLFQPFAYCVHRRGGWQAPDGAFEIDKDGGI